MNFSQAMEVSKSIDEMAKALKATLCGAIEDQPLNGHYINDGKKGRPVMAIIQFSALNDNWSPEYHLPPAQARAVSRYLSKYNSAAGICAAVMNILENGYVVEGQDKTILNAQTMETIRKSEIGQYVINHNPEVVVIKVTDIEWFDNGPFDRAPKSVKLEFPRKLLQDEGCMDCQGSMLEKMYEKICTVLEKKYDNPPFRFEYNMIRPKYQK